MPSLPLQDKYIVYKKIIYKKININKTAHTSLAGDFFLGKSYHATPSERRDLATAQAASQFPGLTIHERGEGDPRRQAFTSRLKVTINNRKAMMERKKQTLE